jgi:protein-disulfide isomerase
MIEVKIFGSDPPCSKCKEVEKRARKTAEKYPGKVNVTKFSAFDSEADKYGILMTPTVVVNDKVTAVGKVPSEDELDKMIGKAMTENK